MEYAIQERRKRERIELRCPVQIFRAPESRAVDAATVNLSSDGVYWISNDAFSPGDRIQCSISITPPGFRAQKIPLFLHCRVHVVRVEETGSGFGVGCRIEQFELLPASGSGASPDHEVAPLGLPYVQDGCS